jgi:hypothetical protein
MWAQQTVGRAIAVLQKRLPWPLKRLCGDHVGVWVKDITERCPVAQGFLRFSKDSGKCGSLSSHVWLRLHSSWAHGTLGTTTEATQNIVLIVVPIAPTTPDFVGWVPLPAMCKTWCNRFL